MSDINSKLTRTYLILLSTSKLSLHLGLHIPESDSTPNYCMLNPKLTSSKIILLPKHKSWPFYHIVYLSRICFLSVNSKPKIREVMFLPLQVQVKTCAHTHKD